MFILIGRILYALPLGVFGLFHFLAGTQMAGMVPSWLPGGVFWVYLTGVALMGAAISILFRIKTRMVGFLLALMLGGFVVLIHLPGMAAEDPGMKQMAMAGLLKDLSLMGGALIIAFGRDTTS